MEGRGRKNINICICSSIRQFLLHSILVLLQLIFSHSSKRKFSALQGLHARNMTWRALHCQSYSGCRLICLSSAHRDVRLTDISRVRTDEVRTLAGSVSQWPRLAAWRVLLSRLCSWRAAHSTQSTRDSAAEYLTATGLLTSSDEPYTQNTESNLQRSAVFSLYFLLLCVYYAYERRKVVHFAMEVDHGRHGG